MPKANFWIVLAVKGDDASRVSATHAFDMHESAVVYLKAHTPSVLLGGKTVSDAAAKCFGRLPVASLIGVTYELPRNAGRSHATIAVPDRGPVTVAEKRENRADVRAVKVAKRAVAAAAEAKVVQEVEAKEAEDAEEGKAARKAWRKEARRAVKAAAEAAAEAAPEGKEVTSAEEASEASEEEPPRKAAKRAKTQ